MPDDFRQVGADTGGVDDYKRILTVESRRRSAEYTTEGERDAMVALGEALPATIDSLPVVKWMVEDLECAGAARLTISCATDEEDENPEDPNEPGGAEVDPLGEPQYSIEFQEVRRKIEAHPNCGTLAEGTTKTWDDWADLVEADYVEDVSGWAPWDLATYQDLKKRGVDEYVTYFPVVKRTLYYRARPFGVGASSGKIQSPPVGVYSQAGDFEWLAGPDAIYREGDKFRRESTWMGADEVSTDIYEVA